MKGIREGVCLAEGFTAGAGRAGIKESSPKNDTAILYSSIPCQAAAVYTTNQVKAAPLLVNMEHLKDGKAQAVVINSGNANAAARNGMENAEAVAQAAAKVLNLPVSDVLVASTGVIGKELPKDKIIRILPEIELSETGSEPANEAIMTTDTKLKSTEVSFVLDGKVCHMGGIAKGSGMIHPNMGTMLCFITTDAAVSSDMIQKALLAQVKVTFNRITVDGDTSTNDMVICMANGLAGNVEVAEPGAAYDSFEKALHEVMEVLAIDIAADGEGASRLLSVHVNGAKTEAQAEKLARSVAGSTLLKAAMFGKDANWGRVMCALGYAGSPFDPDRTDIGFSSKAGEVLCCKAGRELDFDEDLAASVLAEDAVDINVDLHEGDASATCWGCDLTYDYVRINGDYRT